MKSQTTKKCSGFTLMETLLAVALVGLLVSIFLTVFVPARGIVQQALTKQEAERITGILRAEMDTIRPNEQPKASAKSSTPNEYLTTFDKGFYWIRQCKQPKTAIVIFSYVADTTKKPLADGTFPPATGKAQGKATQLMTVVCPMNDRLHAKHIKSAVGPVFVVKMTQLVLNKQGGYSPVKTPGTIQGANKPEDYVSEENADHQFGGVIFYRADFYLMAPPNPDRYARRTWARMGRPIFSANLSFHR